VLHAGFMTSASARRGLAVAMVALAVSGCTVKLKDMGFAGDGGSSETVAYMMTDPDAPAPADDTIRVKEGDTLFGLAQRNNVPVGTLAAVNGLSAPYRIAPGETLALPSRDATVIVPAAARP